MTAETGREHSPIRGTIVGASEHGVEIELEDGRLALARRSELLPAQAGFSPQDLLGSSIMGLISRGAGGRVGGSRTVELSPLWLARTRFQRALEREERLRGRVTELNRGGAVVEVDGLCAFVPRTELRGREAARGPSLAGSRWRGYVIQVRRRAFVLSSYSPAHRRRRARARRRWATRHTVGERMTGRVVALDPSGAQVQLDRCGVEALVPSRELSWWRVRDPGEEVSLGDRLQVQLLELVPHGRHGRPAVIASRRASQSNPWPALARALPPGSAVACELTETTGNGAFARLAGHPRAESFLRSDQLSRLEPGGGAPPRRFHARIASIDVEARHIHLSDCAP